ncbi:MAG: alpha/beta hydrolase [Ruminococcus sp.]|nr:alpha/beta hydrolase [Ruminococcus sp.]
MKRTISIILTALIIATTLCACSVNVNITNGHTVYVRDDFFSETITAIFSSTDSEDTEEIKMTLVSEGDEYNTYSAAADTDKFDRVVLVADGDKSGELAFNDYVSGWHLSSDGVVPFTYDEDEPEPDYEIVTLPYSKTEKDIYIWTPDDYDESEKYSVIYMTDGQNLFNKNATSTGSWGAAESVKSMMKLSEHKAIIVGIDDSTSNRDSELTPNIGKSTDENFDGGTGEYFSDFVVGDVVPYIESNYSVYTTPEHNSICGSSSGGIESFYIGMEHPDKFGTIGALSPAFSLFDDETWVKYLKQKDFSDNTPFVYIFNGNNDDLETYLLEGAKSMVNNLKEVDYPDEKVTIKIYDKGQHNERNWRMIFPEFLKFAFPSAEQ